MAINGEYKWEKKRKKNFFLAALQPTAKISKMPKPSKNNFFSTFDGNFLGGIYCKSRKSGDPCFGQVGGAVTEGYSTRIYISGFGCFETTGQKSPREGADRDNDAIY